MRIVLGSILLFLLASSPLCADDADAYNQLLPIVRDPQASLTSRVAAVRTIGRMGSRAAGAASQLAADLTRMRGTELEPLQEAIVETLGLLGSARPALPAFAKAAGRSTDIDQALKRATDLLLAVGDAQDVDALIRQLSSRDSSQRLRAAKALGTLSPAAKVALPNLITSLTDADGDVRRSTIVAIRLIQPEARPTEVIVRAIAVDLQDGDAALRAAAVRSLARLGSAASTVMPAIEGLATDPDSDVRKAVADALAGRR